MLNRPYPEAHSSERRAPKEYNTSLESFVDENGFGIKYFQYPLDHNTAHYAERHLLVISGLTEYVLNQLLDTRALGIDLTSTAYQKAEYQRE